MKSGRVHTRAALMWLLFVAVIASVTAWAVRGVLVRAARMKTVDTSASTFVATPPGSKTKAAVRLDRVDGKELKGTLLEKQSDTVYLVPSGESSTITALLTPETSVVMGNPQDIAVGGIVQLAGTMGEKRVLLVYQVAILTGYVRLSRSPK
jgi:hypothetical protein